GGLRTGRGAAAAGTRAAGRTAVRLPGPGGRRVRRRVRPGTGGRGRGTRPPSPPPAGAVAGRAGGTRRDARHGRAGGPVAAARPAGCRRGTGDAVPHAP